MANFLFSRLSRKSVAAIVIIFLLVIFAGLVFIARSDLASMRENENNVQEQKSVLMPTEINANFLTQVEECLIPTAAAYGYTLRVSSGFRTMEEQDQIYQQGRTENGHIVTEAPAGKSIHNFGFAVDVVDRWNGYDINWDRIAEMANYCGLESGGEGDVAHIEHRDGLTTAQFQRGRKPLELTLPCAIMHQRALAEQKLTLKDLQNCGAPKF